MFEIIHYKHIHCNERKKVSYDKYIEYESDYEVIWINETIDKTSNTMLHKEWIDDIDVNMIMRNVIMQYGMLLLGKLHISFYL